jgi:hypothetical protein
MCNCNKEGENACTCVPTEGGTCACASTTEATNKCGRTCSHGAKCGGKCFWIGAAFRILIVVAIVIGAFKFGVHYGMLLAQQ